MPYFKWQGVDITGALQRGKLAARSPKHLDSLLFKRDIALLSSSSIRLFRFSYKIRLPLKIEWLRQLTTLVKSGILLPDALSIVADQVNNPRLQDSIHTMAELICKGISLSSAVKQHKNIVDPIIIQLIQIGQESGKLSDALDAAIIHLEMENTFYKKFRSALLMPLMTGCFLLGMVIIIFGIIVPRFIDTFASLQQTIPPLTQFMIHISLFMQSWWMIFVIGLVLLFYWLAKKYFSTRSGKIVFDHLCLRLPFIGTIIQQQFLAYMLQSLALLEKSGVNIVLALQIVADSADNIVLKKQLNYLSQEVSIGKSLSEAMRTSRYSLFTDEIIAMVHIGQESGNISFLLEKAAQIYREKVLHQLDLFTILLQPLLIIILGILVVILIFSLYIPMIELAHAL